MKSIIGQKLYDTEKSEKLCDSRIFGDSIWITSNGTLFLVDNICMRISSINQEAIKELLGKENPEKYIEMYGTVEKA